MVDPVSNAIREYKLNKLRNVVNEEKDVLSQKFLDFIKKLFFILQVFIKKL